MYENDPYGEFPTYLIGAKRPCCTVGMTIARRYSSLGTIKTIADDTNTAMHARARTLLFLDGIKRAPTADHL